MLQPTAILEKIAKFCRGNKPAKIPQVINPGLSAADAVRQSGRDKFKKVVDDLRSRGNVCCYKCGIPTGLPKITLYKIAKGKYICGRCRAIKEVQEWELRKSEN